MVCNRVEGHRKGKDMACHDEDQKQCHAGAQQLTAKASHQHLACIRHIGDMRVLPLELSENVARIRCENTQPNEDDNGWYQAYPSDGLGKR